MRSCVQKLERFPFFVTAILFLALASTTNLTIEAQQQSELVRLDRVSSSRATASGLEIQSGGAIMQIIALRDDVLRIRVGPAGTLPEDASWAVLPSSRTSAIPCHTRVHSESVGFKTAKLHVTVEKDPLSLTVTDMAGHVIVAQRPDRPIEYHGAAFRVHMKSPVDEHYFGLGDKTGPLDRRNEAFVDWNTDIGWQESTDPIYKSIPFFIIFGRASRQEFFSIIPGAQASTSTRRTGTAIPLALKTAL